MVPYLEKLMHEQFVIIHYFVTKLTPRVSSHVYNHHCKITVTITQSNLLMLLFPNLNQALELLSLYDKIVENIYII